MHRFELDAAWESGGRGVRVWNLGFGVWGLGLGVGFFWCTCFDGTFVVSETLDDKTM